VSAHPYASNNLAAHVGDDDVAVRANRQRLAADTGLGDAGGWVWLRQVHGDAVADVDATPPEPPEADAAVTDRAGLPLVVLVADCAPIALVGEQAVGVVHAGWQGLERGVVDRAVGVLRARDVPGAAIRAVIGPCIRPGRYEFGTRDLRRLAARFGPGVVGTTDWGAAAFDLPAAVRIALAGAGVTEVTDTGVCTSTSPDHFSHRRDGTTGRQAVVVVKS
jgi:YfiH family protein